MLFVSNIAQYGCFGHILIIKYNFWMGFSKNQSLKIVMSGQVGILVQGLLFG